jgi:uncharacterized membrane protein YraQ (UPF0718 family)
MADCHDQKSKIDLIFWGSISFIVPLYIFQVTHGYHELDVVYLNNISLAVYELINKMWWGLLLGIFFVGFLDKVPREFVMSILGNKRGITSILRATMAGFLLDLCSHGILLVGMKIYERGASLGQVMAFLIASPWNSFSLTIILLALIGIKWTLVFLLLSFIIAIISGVIFNKLEDKNILPSNPNKSELPENFNFFKDAKEQFSKADISASSLIGMLVGGFKGSRMIVRWLLFGVLLAALIRTFVSTDSFQDYFGPTLMGLGITLVVATIIEVCSEGSTPIAADILNRAKAPGNSFTFLMSGVSTDYTEIISLKETTKSWKISLFLPLVTLPQILILGFILNYIKL